MSGITASGNNLAAELTLNKIMNGQIQTESGRTVNAASRANSAEFVAQAAVLGSYTPTIRESSTILQNYQSELSAYKSALVGAQESLQGASLESAVSIATSLENMYTGISGNDLFDTASTINGGLGVNISAGNITSDGITGIDTAVKAISAATDEAGLATAITGLTTALTTNSGFTALTAAESQLGSEIRMLEERATLLDDITNNYNNGAANQYVQSVTGATSLLENVIG